MFSQRALRYVAGTPLKPTRQLSLSCLRGSAACLKITVTKKNDGGSLRLNRHVPHWSNVSFIAEHSEMIKIFRFPKNHKEIQ